MIFVTVGTQLPFDRLIRAVDEWANDCGRGDVVGQIGPSEYKPQKITVSKFMSPQIFDRHFTEAELIIAHAGMGSILGALSAAKPILVMPRQSDLGEHRNNHQLATATRFRGRPGIIVADNETELRHHLDNSSDIASAYTPISAYASSELLETIRNFIAAS